MGRPTKCTPRARKAIVSRVSQGIAVTRAAEAIGIDPSTITAWKELGGKGKQPYAKFTKELKEAQDEFERRNISIIQKAATEEVEEVTEHIVQYADGTVKKEIKRTKKQPQWTAAAWLVERRLPDYYSRTERQKHEGAVPVEEQRPQEIKLIITDPKNGSEEEL